MRFTDKSEWEPSRSALTDAIRLAPPAGPLPTRPPPIGRRPSPSALRGRGVTKRGWRLGKRRLGVAASETHSGLL